MIEEKETIIGNVANSSSLSGTLNKAVEYITPETDYNELKNKPSINDVELTGNKTLDELGIQPKGDYLIEHQDISGKEDKSNKTTILDENSTDEQYPSAKSVFDALSNVSGGGSGEETKYYFSNIDFYNMGVNTSMYNISKSDPLYTAILENAIETDTTFILKPFFCKSSGYGANYPMIYFTPASYHHRGMKHSQNNFSFIGDTGSYKIKVSSQTGGTGLWIRKYVEVNSDNNTAFVPENDYQPANKKYVDDAITNAITNTLGGSY